MLHYVVIGPIQEIFHVAYKIPDTNKFSSVATTRSFSCAEELANSLNNSNLVFTEIPPGIMSFDVEGENDGK